uniref:Uncharacterized protein n=1 Tax=Parascaris univalens TaxID=6257 RepID=A0A914ZXU1_PARUN
MLSFVVTIKMAVTRAILLIHFSALFIGALEFIWPPWCIQPWEFVPQSAECVLRFESLGINEDEVKDDICRSFGFALDPKRMSCIRYNGFYIDRQQIRNFTCKDEAAE